MPIYLRCPHCKSDQSVRNKICKRCGETLPKQAKTYKVVVKYAGKTISKHVPNSIELAKQIESELKAQLVKDEYIPHKPDIILDEFYEKYYLPHIKKTKRSWEADASRYRVYLKPRWGNKRLSKITPYEVEKLITDLKDSLKPQTIKHIIQLLNRIFNLAIKWELYMGLNPISKVERPKVDNEIIQYLTKSEVKKLIKVCLSYPDRDAGDIVLFALFTGLRRSDIFGLTWDNIDFDNSTLLIKERKTGRPKTFPLNQLALKVLKNRSRLIDNPYIFPGLNGGPRKRFERPWKKIKELAGIDPSFRFHSLRHAFASLLVSHGVGIYEIAKLLGHSDLRMSQRYSHFLPGHLKDASETLTKVIKVDFGKK